MEDNRYEKLKLDNQLCFPLYACAKEVVRLYRPHLDALELTYTQYITMMVVWEKKTCSVKEICERLYLDSGTLTPVLKTMEKKGLLVRRRSSVDERCVDVEITEKGEALRNAVLSVPDTVGNCIQLEPAEAIELYRLLHKILNNIKDE